MTELTRRASTIVAVLEAAMAGTPAKQMTTTLDGNAAAVLAAHGHPSTRAMHRNILALRPLGDLPVTFDINEQDSAMTEQPAVDTLAVFLNAAKAHDRKPIANTATKILDLIERLRDDIKADEAAATRRREIAELEAKLAELKGTKAKSTASGDSHSKEIRAWAAANGVPCRATGRVPRNVREAYELAQVPAQRAS